MVPGMAAILMDHMSNQQARADIVQACYPAIVRECKRCLHIFPVICRHSSPLVAGETDKPIVRSRAGLVPRSRGRYNLVVGLLQPCDIANWLRRLDCFRDPVGKNDS